MKQTLSLEHNYKAPAKNTGANPAIILIHGYGSNEEDLFSFAPELPDHYHIISLKAPIPMQPSGNAWYNIHWDNKDGKMSDIPQAIIARELISKCIDEVVAKYAADAKDITLIGFSQGTILSFSVGLSHPNKVKNIIGLSGYINTELLKDGYEQNDFSNLNVYSSHGSVDQVLPVEWARKTKPFLKNLGIDCAYSEFPIGHGVAPPNFFEMKAWLSEVKSEK
jgi:phospholipase/carboxylesterase